MAGECKFLIQAILSGSSSAQPLCIFSFISLGKEESQQTWQCILTVSRVPLESPVLLTHTGRRTHGWTSNQYNHRYKSTSPGQAGDTDVTVKVQGRKNTDNSRPDSSLSFFTNFSNFCSRQVASKRKDRPTFSLNFSRRAHWPVHWFDNVDLTGTFCRSSLTIILSPRCSLTLQEI